MNKVTEYKRQNDHLLSKHQIFFWVDYVCILLYHSSNITYLVYH